MWQLRMGHPRFCDKASSISIEVSERNREELDASKLSNNNLGSTRECPDNEEVSDLSNYLEKGGRQP